MEQLDATWEQFRVDFARLVEGIQKAIVGYEDLITDTLVAFFSQGHVLLEGVPGLGKTYLVRVLAQVLGVSSGRVQCTPDLMPADILGTHIVSEDAAGRRAFRFEKGPVFANLLLVDEINRTTPKTQAALLEVMQEHTVTAGGEQFVLPEPFFVMATQNPLEMEGTYPLPEAQLDRFFFKVLVPFPDLEALVEISNRTTGFSEPHLDVVMSGQELIAMQKALTHVPVAEPIVAYAAAMVLATHPESEHSVESARRCVAYGASPRGLQAIIRGARAHCVLAGRTAVSVADLHRVVKPALRHRVILNFEGEAEALDVEALIDELLENVPTPDQEAVV